MSAVGDDLVRRARAGNADAWNELLALLLPVMRDHMHGLVGPRLRRFVSISDLEQDALVDAREVLERLQDDASVADFQALMLLHARWSVGKAVARHRRSEGESAAAEAVVPASERSLGSVTRADDLRWFHERVAELPEGQRTVVEARTKGLTFAQIGARLEIGEDAARKRFLAAATSLHDKTSP